MSRIVDSNLAGLSGQVLMCDECRRATPHFAADGGVPVCGCCGATPVSESYYIARQEQQRAQISRAPAYATKRASRRRR